MIKGKKDETLSYAKNKNSKRKKCCPPYYFVKGEGGPES